MALCKFCGNKGCLFCGKSLEQVSTADDVARANALPSFEPRTHVRSSDPDTSKAAAASVVDATEVQRRVLALFDARGGMTDEELLAAYQEVYPRGGQSAESLASPRKRRSDLATAGFLVDSGERRLLRSGRKGIVWTRAR